MPSDKIVYSAVFVLDNELVLAFTGSSDQL